MYDLVFTSVVLWAVDVLSCMVSAANPMTGTVNCPTGRVLAGGCDVSTLANVYLSANRPVSTTGWYCAAMNTLSQSVTVRDQ
jgi:hypothetical protein